MNTKCTQCNKHMDFRNRRGAKLSDYLCQCGGRFERLKCIGSVTQLEQIATATRYDGSTFEYTALIYAYENSKGEQFIIQDNKYISNPYPIGKP